MASFLSSLFGKLTGAGAANGGDNDGAGVAGEAEDYKGFTITPVPRPSGGQYNTAGQITREIDGEVKKHQFIRADTHAGREEAIRHSLSKAKQIIDEQGDRLFG
ncbi:MAG TPA: HlyU family transcriptional regulator [Afifellaceae bacterium]|nr:HlyU family transcriptional regulator [Afifellaceae bacterium]